MILALALLLRYIDRLSTNGVKMESCMHTLTLRSVPRSVELRLRKLAKDSNRSINKTAIDLLEAAVGLGTVKKKPKKLRDVSSVMRKWSEAEIKEFEKNTACFESIDADMWSV